MAWKFDKPFYSMSDDAEQERILKMWGEEKYSGLMLGNARLPFPFTILIGLIVLTSFLLTMPIWGQRPTAELYQDYVKHMNDPEIQALKTPEEKSKRLYALAYQAADSHPDARYKGQLERHPLEWDDLLNLAPQIIELQQQTKYPLNNFTVVGDKVVLANFEGPWHVADNGERVQERRQVFWDKGMLIDVFYVTYFFLWMVFMIKRLPHFSKTPVYPAYK